MIARRLMLATPALLLARPGPAMAQSIAWNGVPSQGGLLRGQAAPGTRLELDGRALRVSPGGQFAMGFGRDHDDSASLAITHPDGRREVRRLSVEQRRWDVQRITGLPGAMVSPDAAALRRISQERALLAAARAVDSAGTGFMAAMAWPARGRISGVYGSQRILNGQPRQPHYGLDVAAPTGTPVHAALPGRVTLSGDFFFFGQILVIDHGHGVNTLHAHLSQRIARDSQVVEQGERIGLIGATGRVTGPHLHFSLSWYQLFLDPQALLPLEQG